MRWQQFNMTPDSNLKAALDANRNLLNEMRRRLAWALGSATGILMASIVATVVLIETRPMSTLPANSGLTQAEYPMQTVSERDNDRMAELGRAMPS